MAITFPNAAASGLYYGECRILFKVPAGILGYLTSVYYVVVVSLIPIIVMAILYIKMYLSIRKGAFSNEKDFKTNQSQESVTAKAQHNIFQTCVIIVTFYFLCWIYNCGESFLFMAGILPGLTSDIYQSTLVCILFNSGINPFIYTLRYKQFKSCLGDLFCHNMQKPDRDTVHPVTSCGSV